MAATFAASVAAAHSAAPRRRVMTPLRCRFAGRLLARDSGAPLPPSDLPFIAAAGVIREALAEKNLLNRNVVNTLAVARFRRGENGKLSARKIIINSPDTNSSFAGRCRASFRRNGWVAFSQPSAPKRTCGRCVTQILWSMQQ